MKSGTASKKSFWLLAAPAAATLFMSGLVAGRTSVRPALESRQARLEARGEATDDRRLSTVEQELKQLRAFVVATSNKGAQGDDDDEEVAAEDTASAAPDEERESEEGLNEARGQFIAGLSRRMQDEPRDPAWSRAIESAISELLPARLGAGVQVSEVSCSSTLCRAKVSHPSSARLSSDRISDFMLDRGPLASMSVQLDLEEEGSTVLYFERAPL